MVRRILPVTGIVVVLFNSRGRKRTEKIAGWENCSGPHHLPEAQKDGEDCRMGELQRSSLARGPKGRRRLPDGGIVEVPPALGYRSVRRIIPEIGIVVIQKLFS